MFRTLITFGAGVYTGAYVAQNYEVDKVEDPYKLFERAVNYIQEKLKSDK